MLRHLHQIVLKIVRKKSHPEIRVMHLEIKSFNDREKKGLNSLFHLPAHPEAKRFSAVDTVHDDDYSSCFTTVS
jgi:hypothetical protein